MLLKNILKSLVAALLLSAFSYGQSQQKTEVANITVVEQYIKINDPNKGATTYSTDAGYAWMIGRLDDQDFYDRYRTRAYFSFSGDIPQGARINSCILTVSIWSYSSGSTTAKIVKLPVSFGDGSGLWTQIDNASTVYYGSLTYQQTGGDLPANSTLTSDVQSAVNGSGVLVLGIASLGEATNGTNAQVSISMKVNFTPKVVVTVQNSFAGGQVEVDGVLKTSPWTSGTSGQPTYYSGDAHNIRGYTQTIGGLTYTFPEPGTWSSTCGQQRTQSNNNTPVSINPTSNCAMTASFNQGSIQVTVYQKFSTGTPAGGTIGHWEGGPNFASYAAGAPIPLITGSQALLGTQTLVYNGINYAYEKYYKWVKGATDESDAQNHHVFTVGPGFPNNLTSQLNQSASGPSVTVAFPEGTATFNSPTVQFADPWFINYPDPSYNYNVRNQGINAPLISRSAPFTPTYSNSYDAGYTYKGVFLNQTTNLGNYYTVGAPTTQSITANGQNYQSVFYNWTISGGGSVSQPTNPTTPIVFGGSSSIAYANYKGIHLSNDASAFVNNSQKKLVRTPNGTNGFLHQVYTSLGHVWYEYSTDNGATWNNGNNGLSLDGGNGGKCPSIDWETQTNHVIIVWQEKSGNYSTIKYMTFFPNTNTSYAPNSPVYPIYNEAVDLYSSKDANPNITVGLSGIWGLTIERQNPDPNNGVLNGINFFFGESFDGNVLRSNGVDITGAFAIITPISGTDANSINASFNVCKSQGSNDVFELAWEQYVSGTQSSIKWLEMAEVSLGGNQYTLNPLALPAVNLSSYTSYVCNTLPSIISLPNGSARVCWIGDLDGLGTTVNAVLLNPSNHSIMMATGAKVKSVSMNHLDDGSKCYVVYSQNTFRTSWSDNARSSADNYGSTQLMEAGEYVQLSNGTSSSNIYVSSFYPFSTPYYFKTSVSLGSKGLGKTAGRQGAYGRGAIVMKDSLRFYYSFENLIVDNNNINFVDAPDKVNYNNLDTLNRAWLTQPFSITNKSTFSFTENSGFVDTVGALKTLGSNGFIGFKIELLDNATGRVLGGIKNNTFNASNAHGDRVTPYLLKTNGIGSKTVRVRITMSSSIEKPTLTLLIKYPEADSTNGLQKTSVNELTLDEVGVVAEYALSQNFPNPFNPTTTINYQIPKDGHVLIKIYDALGREVRILVDEDKPSGAYSVNFDASHLSSGIYFYSIRSGDYTAVKKMALIK